MMDYNLFKSVVVNRIQDFLPPIYSEFAPEIETVRKVNEVKDALIMRPDDEESIKALPMVYLDEMYGMFMECQDLDEIMRQIATVIVNYTGYYPNEAVEIDFSKMKDRVIANIVSSEMNQELMENIPHVDIVNMSVIYRVIVSAENQGFNSVIVNNKVLDEMGLTLEELHNVAMENSRRLFPEKITELDEGVVVLSNEANIFGASTLLYDGVMGSIGEMMGEDEFYVVPSSIHELILVSKKNASAEKLVEMLAEGNSEITMDRDILSNSIYLYDCNTKSIGKAASYKRCTA